MVLIIINGKEFSKEDILKNKIEESLQNDFAEAPLELTYIDDFLKQWCGDSDYIEVKTSGSTGNPKTIRLSKRTMINSALATVRYFSLQKADKVLLPLSASYIAGKMMIVRAIVAGLRLDIIPPSSDPLKYINKQYDFAPFVPMQLECALRNGSISNISLVKKVIIGGAAVSASLAGKILEYESDIYTTYGMTETASHVAVSKLKIDGKDSFYEALPGVLFHTDDRGCLVIEAPDLCDDSLITNDIVEIYDDKHFIWKGRIDNVVNSGGVKLHIESIEAKIDGFINESFFLAGEKDKVLGESLVLVIESQSYCKEAEEILLSQLSSILGKYEMPKRIVYKKEFDKTDSGKVKRNLN